MNHKTYRRMMRANEKAVALYLRANGWPLEDIGAAVARDARTVSKWLKWLKWQKLGLDNVPESPNDSER